MSTWKNVELVEETDRVSDLVLSGLGTNELGLPQESPEWPELASVIWLYSW